MVKANLVTETADSGTQFVYNVAADGDDRRYCKCGCNQQVVGKKLYRPGHDARHVAALTSIVVTQTTQSKQDKAMVKALDELDGSPRLRMKLAIRVLARGGSDYTGLAVNEDAAEDE